MIEYVNECCGCAVPGYPCIGASCPNRNVPRYRCDVCGVGGDIYEVEDIGDLCMEHLEEYLQESFDELVFQEKAEILKISVKKREN